MYYDYGMKYGIVTWSAECGYDEKEYTRSMAESKRLVREYLRANSEVVYVLSDKTIKRVFSKDCRQGRKPFDWEIKKFNF